MLFSYAIFHKTVATEDEKLHTKITLQSRFASGEAPIILGGFGGMFPRKIFDS